MLCAPHWIRLRPTSVTTGHRRILSSFVVRLGRFTWHVFFKIIFPRAFIRFGTGTKNIGTYYLRATVPPIFGDTNREKVFQKNMPRAFEMVLWEMLRQVFFVLIYGIRNWCNYLDGFRVEVIFNEGSTYGYRNLLLTLSGCFQKWWNPRVNRPFSFPSIKSHPLFLTSNY